MLSMVSVAWASAPTLATKENSDEWGAETCTQSTAVLPTHSGVDSGRRQVYVVLFRPKLIFYCLLSNHYFPNLKIKT